jgi:hypothetical protein
VNVAFSMDFIGHGISYYYFHKCFVSSNVLSSIKLSNVFLPPSEMANIKNYVIWLLWNQHILRETLLYN